ncbi:MAG: LiaF domain-containing protein [Clostridia bacterium]
MKKKSTGLLLGIALILLGIGFAGNNFNLWVFDPLFSGWWTLFIIVPCLLRIVEQGFDLGSVIGLLIGIALLLMAQDVINYALVSKLIFPGLLVLIGIRLLFSKTYQNIRAKLETVGTTGQKNYNATFSGMQVNFNGEEFQGAIINAIFGGVTLDLRGAKISSDVVIDCTAVFGGIDIYAPQNISVQHVGTSIFGGVSNHANNSQGQNSFTIYIKNTCLFGGVEIR